MFSLISWIKCYKIYLDRASLPVRVIAAIRIQITWGSKIKLFRNTNFKKKKIVLRSGLYGLFSPVSGWNIKKRMGRGSVCVSMRINQVSYNLFPCFLISCALLLEPSSGKNTSFKIRSQQIHIQVWIINLTGCFEKNLSTGKGRQIAKKSGTQNCQVIVIVIARNWWQ